MSQEHRAKAWREAAMSPVEQLACEKAVGDERGAGARPIIRGLIYHQMELDFIQSFRNCLLILLWNSIF